MTADDRIVAIILARGGSKGIPRKNVKILHDLPLMAWTIRQVQDGGISEIYVSTDDEEIAQIAIEYGAQVIARPDELATDDASGDDGVIHALEALGAHDDTIVLIPQVTSPLRTGEHVRDIVGLIASREVDSAFSGVQIDDICVWSNSGTPRSITYDYRSRAMRQLREPLFVENGSLYCTRADAMRTSRNRLSGATGITLMPKWTLHEIDDPEDFELCKVLMEAYVIDRTELSP